jgi:hypothetical protein
MAVSQSPSPIRSGRCRATFGGERLRVPADILSACGLDRDSLLTDADARKLGALQMALVAYGSDISKRHAPLPQHGRASFFPAFLPLALAGADA